MTAVAASFSTTYQEGRHYSTVTLNLGESAKYNLPTYYSMADFVTIDVSLLSDRYSVTFSAAHAGVPPGQHSPYLPTLSVNVVAPGIGFVTQPLCFNGASEATAPLNGMCVGRPFSIAPFALFLDSAGAVYPFDIELCWEGSTNQSSCEFHTIVLIRGQ